MAGSVRRVAWVGVRFHGRHDLRAGPASGAARVAREPAPARRVPPRGHRLVWRDHLLDFPDRLGGLGGVLFGVLADRFGRTKTLIFTILIYAVFTGLAACSATWWQLAIYRFLTALGIGGEWAAGAALVAEVWPEEKRVQGGRHPAVSVGRRVLPGGARQPAHARYGWRPIFVVGMVPAVVALSGALVGQRTGALGQGGHERDAAQRRQRRPGLAELFGPRLLARSTLVGSGLAFVAVFGLWGATNWTPTLVRALPSCRAWKRRGLQPCQLCDHAAQRRRAGRLPELWPAGGPLRAARRCLR